VKLRKYQDDALHYAYLAEQEGLNRLLIAHPTGLGKTIVLAQWLNERTGRGIVIAHRDELIRQAVAKLRMVLPQDVTVGVVKAEEHEPNAEIIVASIQSLSEKRLKDVKDVQAIVVDEAHHSEAESYQRVLRTLGAFDGVMTLGVTATPYRGDGKDLGQTWQRIVHHVSIQDAIKDGHLCALKAYRVSTRANFSKLKVQHGDFSQGQAGAELLAANAPEQIAQAVAQYGAGRPTLIFCPTVDVSVEVEAAVRKHRPCMHVDGTTDPVTRSKAITFLQKGGAVTNCGIYTEGFDCPEVSCVVVARPTKSQTLYVQMIGRGTRNAPGKENCIILDVVGATMRHDLCTARILAVGASEEEERALALHKAWKDRQQKDAPPGGAIAAVEIDLWGKRPFAWVKTNLGYVLDVGRQHGKLLLAPDGNMWCVWQRNGDEQRKLWKGTDLGYGQGFAEEWVRDRGADRLCRKDADWRNDPITEGQAAALTRLRIPWNEHTTKGQASDAISWSLANAGRW
jgi:superfamily II DNA or RNA helicase